MNVTVESTLAGQLPSHEDWKITESTETSCRWERDATDFDGRVSVVLIYDETDGSWSVSSREGTGEVGKEKILIRSDLSVESALEEVESLFSVEETV